MLILYYIILFITILALRS